MSEASPGATIRSSVGPGRPASAGAGQAASLYEAALTRRVFKGENAYSKPTAPGEFMLYDPNVLKTVPDCRLALERATQAGEAEFVKPLYVRLAQLGGVGYSDPLEAAFHSLLAVYEQTLKRGRANRVRIKLDELGGGVTAAEKILIDWCRAKRMSSGFERMVEFGLKDRVGEYIVGIDFPDRFPSEVVEAARAKLIRYDIVTVEELRRLVARPRN